ncbi:MarR family winged helix-turn-helix transcriptional regulator [uncultured Pseudodesulfovibrio sp.]|uniref:MarR family winged helix-turn-helix transcriptional regulator n=1 Tax=uncultured Pseudodesulfovibrio sp. TaxID=2035858 RepID=UPI0029C6BEC9|nr:MarR family winged helix-turn-helix transcriptional regulator [uncultured Pseudodesulfovibrio sp.]
MDFKKQRAASLGYRIARLFRMNSCRLDRWLAEFGLCHGQVPYLISITEKSGQTQDELAAQVHVHRAATARILKNMEAAGLVTRKENPENRRQNLVFPTDKSCALIGDVVDVLDIHNETLLKGFSDEERELLFSMMDRILENAEWSKDDKGGPDALC